MKICLVSGHFFPREIGGAEKAARCLAENLVARGCEVTVLTSWRRDETEVLDSGVTVRRIRTGPVQYLEDGAPLPYWRRWRFRLGNVWNVAARRKVEEVLRCERPRLVNVHNYAPFSPSVFAAARALGLPVVFTAHDYFPLCRHYSFEKNGRPCRGHCLACRLWSRWNRRYLAGTAAVYLSEQSRAVYSRHVQAPRSLLWPNPVDLEPARIAAIGEEKAEFRRRRPGFPVTWLFLGRLDPLKGVRAVMRCWERLDDPCLRLCIAGDGPQRHEVEAWAEGRPGVEYLGAVHGAAKHEALIAADGLLLPSRATDVSPLVIPEALAYGIPVLGLRRGALTEMIEPGATGWLVDVDDAAAFARSVAEISRQPGRLRAMSGACLGAARGRTFAAAMPRLMDFFERVAAGPIPFP